MSGPARILLCSAVVSALLVFPGASPNDARAASKFQVLVFTRTEGFRHDSVPAGAKALRKLGKSSDFSVTATKRARAFRTKRLREFDVVVFLSTTGDVLDPKGERALSRFIRKGRGFVGIHSAADTEYGWPFYGGLLGAYFKSHPATQTARIEVVDRGHPSTRHLPATWVRTDEWYDFQANPRGAVHVLARLDESSYSGGMMGADHPIAWCHRFSGGRSWYTAGGHTIESFSERNFRRHLLGGIRWAAKRSKGSCPLA